MEQTNFLNEFRKKYTILTSIILVIVYLSVLKSTKWIIPHSVLLNNRYLGQFIAEAISIVFILLLIAVFSKWEILYTRRVNFLQGLFTGGFIFTIALLTLWGNLVAMRMKHAQTAPISHVIAFVLAMLAIGISEEFLFRGIIFQSLLEKFSNTRKGTYAAVAISGLIFGLAHASNILSGATIEGVLVQMISAIFLGALLAAIYFRTKNIWVVVFLHAFVDFSALLSSGIFKIGTLVGTISSYSYLKLIFILIYIIPIVIILRYKKVDEVLQEQEQS